VTVNTVLVNTKFIDIKAHDGFSSLFRQFLDWKMNDFFQDFVTNNLESNISFNDYLGNILAKDVFKADPSLCKQATKLINRMFEIWTKRYDIGIIERFLSLSAGNKLIEMLSKEKGLPKDKELIDYVLYFLQANIKEEVVLKNICVIYNQIALNKLADAIKKSLIPKDLNDSVPSKDKEVKNSVLNIRMLDEFNHMRCQYIRKAKFVENGKSLLESYKNVSLPVILYREQERIGGQISQAPQYLSRESKSLADRIEKIIDKSADFLNNKFEQWKNKKGQEFSLTLIHAV
jgi:hypothetical protein